MGVKQTDRRRGGNRHISVGAEDWQTGEGGTEVTGVESGGHTLQARGSTALDQTHSLLTCSDTVYTVGGNSREKGPERH